MKIEEYKKIFDKIKNQIIELRKQGIKTKSLAIEIWISRSFFDKISANKFSTDKRFIKTLLLLDERINLFIKNNNYEPN